MPTPTATLANVLKALGGDNARDYLKVSLANSLEALALMFDPTLGHDHSGLPGTGKPLVSSVSYNELQNGGFEVWQRGNGPFTTSVMSSDRWLVGLAGTDTLSVVKDTVNQDVASNACAACTFVLGTGGGASFLAQNSTVADGYQFGSQPLGLSVRVRTATPNAVRVGIYNGVGWVLSNFHSGSGQYETLSVTLANTPPSSLAGSVAVFFSASCTAYLDSAMLIVGTTARSYVPQAPADDLQRCLRYYEELGTPNGNDLVIGGYQAAGSVVFSSLQFKAVKAVAPTITKVGTWTVSNAGQPVVATTSKTMVLMQVTLTALGYGYASNLGANARITVEANP